MNPSAGFRAVIIARPEDDTPRLVYADWLDEHGEPTRAEFIRVQCAAARAGLVPDQSGLGDVYQSLAALRRRELQLLNKVRPLLEAEMPPTRPHCHSWGFYRGDSDDDLPDAYTAAVSRGFVGRVVVEGVYWAARGPAVVRLQPVTRVTLSDARIVVYDAGDAHLLFDSLPAALTRRGPEQLRPDPYPDEAAALAALSRRCLAWAKSVTP